MSGKERVLRKIGKRRRLRPGSISRIDLVTRNARNLWLGMLAVLMFDIVTLFGVRDHDFFLGSQTTILPLVGVSVPAAHFFGAGSALTASVYIYLHLYLRELWFEIGQAPPTHNGLPLRLRPHTSY